MLPVEEQNLLQEPDPPVLVTGTELLGPYQDGGYDEQRFLIRRSDGHVALVASLLYEVANLINGYRSIEDIASIVSRRNGRALSPEGVHYLISTKLEPLGLVQSSLPVATAKVTEPLLGFSVRAKLIPTRAVRVLARVLAPLFASVIVAVVITGMVAFDVWYVVTHGLALPVSSALTRPSGLLTLLGLVFAATVVHELGHAAGCWRGGGEPGHIGIGIYLLFPACYTDVTDAYRLSRRARVRTDLGGVYFNALFCAIAGAVVIVTGSPVTMVSIVLVHIVALQQLLPVVRFDGYFLLTDIVGVPDLFNGVSFVMGRTLPGGNGAHREGGRQWRALRPRVRVAVSAWVAIVVPLLVVLTGWFLWRSPRFVKDSWHSTQAEWRLAHHSIVVGHYITATVAMLGFVVLAIPLIGAALLAGRATTRGARRLFIS